MGDISNQIICDTTGIKTAIGCIPFNDPTALAVYMARVSIGIAGAFTLVVIAMSGYKIMTSTGDPKTLQAAKEQMFAAISGLIMIAFSAFVLRLIGVDILGLFRS